MTEFNHVVILVTTGTQKEAEKIAGVLLERRKAACVNIVPKVESHFWWEGKLDSAKEALLIIKTKASLVGELIDLVKDIHTYSVPEVIALPIVGGNQEYLEWIDEEVEEE